MVQSDIVNIHESFPSDLVSTSSIQVGLQASLQGIETSGNNTM